MNNVVSLISSPFQLLTLGEYIKKKRIIKYKILILYYSERELNQILEISKFYGLEIINKIYGTKFIQYIKLKILTSKIKNCQELIVGNFFTDPHLFFISSLNYKSLTIIDDGIIVNKIPFYLGTNQKLLKESNLKRLIKTLLKIKYPKKIKLFTIFNIKSSKNILVETNQFEYLNAKTNLFNQTDLLLIIGQPLIENKLITKEEYFKIIKKIVFENNNNSILYCPHRKESEDNVNQILQIRGVDSFNSISSIEVFLIKNNICPKKVVGFTSTALITLDKIFNQKGEKIVIESIKLKLNSKLFLGLYKDIQNHQITIV